MKYSVLQNPAHYTIMFARTLKRPFERYVADKILWPLNIRRTLTLIMSLFGLFLIGLLWSLGSSAYRDYAESSAQIPINQARNDMIEAIIALQENRVELASIGITSYPDSAPETIPGQSVAALRNASQALLMTQSARLQELGRAVEQENAQVETYAKEFSDAVTSGNPNRIEEQSANGVERLDLVRQRLVEIRQAILSEAGVLDTGVDKSQLIRNYVLAVSDPLHQNRLSLVRDVQNGQTIGPNAVRLIEDRTMALQDFSRIFEEVIPTSNEKFVEQALGLSDFLRITYGPAETRYLRALVEDEDMASARQAWITAGDEIDRRVENILEKVFNQSQAQSVHNRAVALSSLQNVLVLSLAAVLVFGMLLSAIERLIIHPLELVQNRMLDLVSGDMVPRKGDEFVLFDLQAMTDALRVFRVNALRRERLANERLSLHARIAEAHSSLQAEMRAAAAVQLTHMPEPGDVGQVRFSTFFAPAHVLAGDTFDYIELPEDNVGLFQVDVAGHGAAAALVSVAAHIGARRALRSLKPGGSLAHAIQTLNAHWNPDMTYFTMVAIKFDTRGDIGRIVQAGHPHPILMGSDGSIRRLGQGGLPVGVMPDAEYEEITFPFKSGDRVFLFSDGVYENMNEHGELFTEERFIELLATNADCETDALVLKVQKSLEAWCGSETFSDDVSLVVAERK